MFKTDSLNQYCNKLTNMHQISSACRKTAYLIRVSSVLVLCPIGCIRERFVTALMLTDIRFFSSVRPQVCFQVF